MLRSSIAEYSFTGTSSSSHASVPFHIALAAISLFLRLFSGLGLSRRVAVGTKYPRHLSDFEHAAGAEWVVAVNAAVFHLQYVSVATKHARLLAIQQPTCFF
jgi:hypothetical protein